MPKLRLLRTLLLSVAVLFASKSAAFAVFIPATPLPEAAHGSVWFVPETVPLPGEPGLFGIPTNTVPSRPADATFSTPIINFSSFGNATNTGTAGLDFTIGLFLDSLGAVPSATYSPVTNQLLGSAPTADTPLIGSCVSGTCTTSGFYGTLIDITGDLLLTTGQHIKIAHDDGVTLKLGGNVQPGFSSVFSSPNVESMTYEGPSGLVSFDLVYSESVVAPAFLQLAVPEPPSLAIMSSALAGFALLWLRSKKRGTN